MSDGKLFRTMYCNCGENAEPMEAFLKATMAELEATSFEQLVPRVIDSLNYDFEASITGIASDQWYGIYAAKDDESFRVAIECDTLPLGFAGVYRAFQQHKNIMAVVAEVPGSSWRYAGRNEEGIGTWTVTSAEGTEVEKAVLQSAGKVTGAAAESPLLAACLKAGFKVAEAVAAVEAAEAPAAAEAAEVAAV